MGVMMPTGCKITLISNSMCTLAYFSSKYFTNAYAPSLVYGDDSVIHSAPKELKKLLGGT